MIVRSFVTAIRFEPTDAVQAFAGEDYEVAVVPPERQLLSRFDAPSAHYELREAAPA